ncbi:hypothetical protein [Nostoc sp. PA-18-2419]|uniref:hypothetical protein n=1 Tax=Nostoc sp. PA-18-2419 TaxID=2575443 RepID=UPI001108F6A6|nr:hypothetical protein [Nostoc sp. PA-18-2419]
MLYINQVEANEYEDVTVSIGQVVNYIDDYGMQSEGEILQVDTDLNMLCVVSGHIISQVSWIHADQLIDE